MATALPIRDAAAPPTLNACVIPPALRHGAIIGALGSRQVGGAMILIAPHNPLPLLKEIEAQAERYEVSYLQQGPQDWPLQFTRLA